MMTESHEIVSDSDAEEETRISITCGSELPHFLKRNRKQGPVTRKERSDVITQTHEVNVKIQRIYIQFGKLCAMIEEQGLEIPNGIIQDFHEHVLDPLCEKLMSMPK